MKLKLELKISDCSLIDGGRRTRLSRSTLLEFMCLYQQHGQKQEQMMITRGTTINKTTITTTTITVFPASRLNSAFALVTFMSALVCTFFSHTISTCTREKLKARCLNLKRTLSKNLSTNKYFCFSLQVPLQPFEFSN